MSTPAEVPSSPATVVLSMIVPTRNRRDVLGRLFESAAAQDRVDFEIIVVDDASDRPVTTDALNRLVPLPLRDRVTTIRFGKPVGACAARNAGTAASRGRYVFFVDDDVELVGTDLFSRLIDLADANPKVGVVALAELAPDGTWGFNLGPQDRPLEVSRFFGCGAFVRKACLDQVGGFLEPLGYYYEEFELSMRVIDSDWALVFCPDLRVVHHRDRRGRDARAIARLISRNALLTVLVRFPAWLVPAALTVQLVRFALRCWFATPIDAWGPFAAALAFVRRLPIAIGERRPIRPASLRRYGQLSRRPEPWTPRPSVSIA